MRECNGKAQVRKRFNSENIKQVPSSPLHFPEEQHGSKHVVHYDSPSNEYLVACDMCFSTSPHSQVKV